MENLLSISMYENNAINKNYFSATAGVGKSRKKQVFSRGSRVLVGEFRANVLPVYGNEAKT